MGRERPLTTQSGRSSNRRNGDECSLPNGCNSRLADSWTAQRDFRYVPFAAIVRFTGFFTYTRFLKQFRVIDPG